MSNEHLLTVSHPGHNEIASLSPVAVAVMKVFDQ